jgi:hypothetical protein
MFGKIFILAFSLLLDVSINSERVDGLFFIYEKHYYIIHFYL